jgi:hypothetical protein
VAHCGTDIEGGYLYTLTLTDVTTGWTECLPLLYRSQETVLAAIQRARTLFPFPILGIDTAWLGNAPIGNSPNCTEHYGCHVNCFQPSMKLLSKERDGEKVRYVYDPAKTPLQRLVLSGILSTEKQHELNAVAQSLDPVRLFHQLEQLQKALFRCAVEGNPFVSNASSLPIRVFAVEQCRTGLGAVEGSVPDAPAGLPALY